MGEGSVHVLATTLEQMKVSKILRPHHELISSVERAVATSMPW